MSSFITLGTPELSVPHTVTTTLVPVVLFQIARGSALYGSNHWAFADALILRDCFVRWDQPPRRASSSDVCCFETFVLIST
jgi:hypothetical protein